MWFCAGSPLQQAPCWSATVYRVFETAGVGRGVINGVHDPCPGQLTRQR